MVSSSISRAHGPKPETLFCGGGDHDLEISWLEPRSMSEKMVQKTQGTHVMSFPFIVIDFVSVPFDFQALGW